MNFGIRVGGERIQIALLNKEEYSQVRRLKPFTRPKLVTNTTACPVVAGRVLQMPSPKAVVPSVS